MSYDIYLRDPDGNALTVPSHSTGATIAIGGSETPSLTVTYNYANYFRAELDAELGIRWLYGKTGAEVEERLARAVKTLGTEQAYDHWAATAGNAGYALSILLNWARLHPTAVFNGD